MTIRPSRRERVVVKIILTMVWVLSFFIAGLYVYYTYSAYWFHNRLSP